MDLGKLRELSDHRVCLECGAEFNTILATKDTPEQPAMAQWSDHLTIHQPTPAQWAVAHELIQAGKQGPEVLAKARERLLVTAT